MTSAKTSKSLKEQILDFTDIPKVPMTIKEWGGLKVEVWGMSAKDRNSLIMGSSDKSGTPDPDKLYFRAVVETVRDPKTGERIFSRDDIAALKEKNGKVLERIAIKAYELCGIGGNADEDAEKN